jgi:DNA repair exonuclease SbcCD ATPase subunit
MSINESVGRVVSQIQDELTRQAEALLAHIESTRGELVQIQSEIDETWQGLAARGESLIARAQQEEERLRDLGRDLEGRAQESRAATDAIIEGANSTFDQARQVVESLDQGVQALIPDADEVMAAVEKTVDTLGEQMQSLGEALEATRVITDQHLHNPFDGLIQDLSGQLTTRFAELGSYVDTDFLVAAREQVSQFASHVDSTVSSMEEKLNEAQATAHQQGSDALSQVQSMFGAQFGALINTAQTVGNVIQQVGTAISSTGQVVGTTTQVMSAGVGTTAIGAKAVIGIVNDIIEIFESVT